MKLVVSGGSWIWTWPVWSWSLYLDQSDCKVYGTILPHGPQKEPTLPTPCFWTSSLQTVKKNYGLIHPDSGTLFQQSLHPAVDTWVFILYYSLQLLNVSQVTFYVPNVYIIKIKRQKELLFSLLPNWSMFPLLIFMANSGKVFLTFLLKL